MTLGIILLAFGASVLSFGLGYLLGYASGRIEAHIGGAK